MGEFLLESGRRANRPSLVQAIMTGANAKYEADMGTMGELVTESQYSADTGFRHSILIMLD